MSETVEAVETVETVEPVAAVEPVEPAQTDEAPKPAETDETDETKAKPEKPWYEKELARSRRRIDNLTRRLNDSLRASGHRLTTEPEVSTNEPQTSDELRLSRADVERLIEERARQLAPQIKQHEAEIEHRRTVVEKLSSTWGKEKFDSLASDLDDALEGLADRSGRPKPATDAIFEADDPAALIEYLADPDHATEAAALSRMAAVQAGRHIAKLEARLQAQKAKPAVSKAPDPIEPIRAGGVAVKDPATMTDAEFAKWRRNQIAQRR